MGYVEILKKISIINMKSKSNKSTNEHHIICETNDCENSENYENRNKNNNNYIIFKDSLKLLLVMGQCFGLNPVLGITCDDPSKVRFQIDAFRFWYSLFIWLIQVIFTTIILYTIFSGSVHVSHMGGLCFYVETCVMTLLFIVTASQWRFVAQEVSASNLFVNPNVNFKCKLAFSLLMLVAIAEHATSIISNVTYITDCVESGGAGDVYHAYVKRNFGFLFDIGVIDHIAVAIFLQLLILACTFNWNYSDLFIISISLYLTSIFEEINKKIYLASNKRKPSSTWRSLREAYTRAARLVRTVDRIISPIILVSFSVGLFFVCFQLFNVFSTGLHGKNNKDCPYFPSGPFRGYEHSMYYLFSLAALIIRAMSVALIAAEVHSASKAALPALYEIPAEYYCDEVQRFIAQIHGDSVALSGYKFFYMTRDLVLSIAGSIVTYELVLLQFRGEDTNISSSTTPFSTPSTTPVF